jgi:flagellar hook assembly protein FlgD
MYRNGLMTSVVGAKRGGNSVGLRRGVAAALVALVVGGLAVPAAAIGPGTEPTLTDPADGAIVVGDVTIAATSTAPSVQFFVDAAEFGTPEATIAGTATTTWPTAALAPGSTHTISAADCDGTGCSDPAAPVTVTVVHDAQLSAPADATAVTGDVTLSATSAGTAVQFAVDGVALGGPVATIAGTATTTWSTWALTLGSSHTITAAGCDGAVCSAPGTPATVTVANAAQITAPTNGKTTGAATTLRASAPTPAVRFYIDGVAKGLDNTAPFELAVSGLAEGAHQVAVRGCNATGTACAAISSTAGFNVRVLHPTITSVSPSPFSPHHDTRRDTTTVTFSLPETETVSWRVVRTSSGTTVRGPIKLGSLRRGTHTVVWGGRNNDGKIVPDGKYTVRVDTSVTLAGGEVARGRATHNVIVDDTAPRLSKVTGAGATFYPYPDDYLDRWTTRVHVDDAATLTLQVTDDTGHVVRRFSAAHNAAGTFGFTWNGKDSNGKRVVAGTYTFWFLAQDRAGNRRSTGRYHVNVSKKRLVTTSKTYTRNGDEATVRTTDADCTIAGYYEDFLSLFPHGVWLDNTCFDAADIWAEYSITVPAAKRYDSISISAYGTPSLHAPEHIFASWYSYSRGEWDFGPSVFLADNDRVGWTALGGKSATGRVSGGRIRVSVDVPNLDGDTDYDLAGVSVTIKYQVLK